MFEIGKIRVLDKSADVSIRIPQVLGKRIRRQKIETSSRSAYSKMPGTIIEASELRKVKGKTAVIFGCWLK